MCIQKFIKNAPTSSISFLNIPSSYTTCFNYWAPHSSAGRIQSATPSSIHSCFFSHQELLAILLSLSCQGKFLLIPQDLIQVLLFLSVSHNFVPGMPHTTRIHVSEHMSCYDKTRYFSILPDITWMQWPCYFIFEFSILDKHLIYNRCPISDIVLYEIKKIGTMLWIFKKMNEWISR